MKRAIGLAGVLALSLTACSSDSDKRVNVDEANELVVSAITLDVETYQVGFRLHDGNGNAVSGVNDYSVTYYGFAGEEHTAFSFPWHSAEQFGCGQEVPACLGDLEEHAKGQYRFLPDQAPEMGWRIEDVKLTVRVHGARTSSAPEVVVPEAAQ
ncbi:hypothetical protein [Ferrimonas marina]|uniref:Lipoprotein n=1 Tax=Ferrimonas marina TaxID=299255 RepID=A0A1M5X1F6_9GAMM|nr:hypothetical protein [Ferrimonas marina]SHH93659.1 hypothetical protein SAMN02745129_3147 [Ferrimonas marina]